MSQPHVLVVGAGSVGKRHLRNFSTLGCQVSAMDPRPDRLVEATEAVPLVCSFSSFDAALAESPQESGVVICSPPKFHVDQATAALEQGLPVFLEKPVSPDADSASRLVDAVRRAKAPLLLGYTYRWWPPVQESKARLEEGVIGKVLNVRCTMSGHLADWHPWERYQAFYMASAELGGGALLDESHFLDLVLWFFGTPTEVFAKVERLSSLEIETDDNVDAWLRYPQGLRVSLHLDLYGRPHERSITMVGENGTLQWSFDPNRVRIGHSESQEWAETCYSNERNDMFVKAAEEFLGVMQEGRTPSCTIEDGYAVLRVIEAMRESSDTGKVVPLE